MTVSTITLIVLCSLLMGILTWLWHRKQKQAEEFSRQLQRASEDLSVRQNQLNDRKERIVELKKQFVDVKEQLDNLDERWEDKFKVWKQQEEKAIRKDSLERSKSVNRGFAHEQFAPYVLGSLDPEDYRHMGNPVDYIVFSGLADLHDGTVDKVDEIIFLDIKTGGSQLNKAQRRIRDAIKAGNVKFATFNPDKKKYRKW